MIIKLIDISTQQINIEIGAKTQALGAQNVCKSNPNEIKQQLF